MLKFAVCDDEPLMVREIAAYINNYMQARQPAAYAVDSFFDGSSFLASDLDYDIIFLDVKMQRPDGLETARLLRRQGRRGRQSLLIFVTAFKEYVFDAFEVQAHDYLLKPLQVGRFKRTMDRAVKELARGRDKTITVQRGADFEVVPLAKIVYCEVQGRKIFIHQSDGSVIDYYDKMDLLAQRVDDRFFRCHRSYLVNLDFVRGCGGGTARLWQNKEIPVSRLREGDLRQALLRHMKER